MTTPIVSQADLQRVHKELCISVPLDQASPLILATLAVVARCWRQKQAPKQYQSQRPLETIQQQPAIDFKRRSAADYD